MRIFPLVLLILPVIGCTSPPEQTEAPAPAPAPAPIAIEPTPAQLVLREKLAELQQIRKTSEFKTYGIGAGGPYGSWEADIDKALAPYTLSFKERLGADELKALMREYISSKGEDTKASEFFRQTVSDAAGS